MLLQEKLRDCKTKEEFEQIIEENCLKDNTGIFHLFDLTIMYSWTLGVLGTFELMNENSIEPWKLDLCHEFLENRHTLAQALVKGSK